MEVDFTFNTGELEAVLNKLPIEMKKKVTRNAVAAGARVIRNEARKLAPYNTRRTGGIHLRDAIRSERIKSTNDVFRIGTRSREAPHAHLQEFGTVAHRARPFLRPAADSSQMKVAGRMIDNLSKGILKQSIILAGKAPKKGRR